MRFWCIGVVCVALCLGACDPETVMRELGRATSGELTDSRIAQGLKEALRVGTDHAVTRTGKRDGYFGNNLKQYNALLGRAKQIPFVKTESLNINNYVTNKALDGLFHVVSEEEKRIREDPAARVTDLLRDVFGRQS